MKLALTAGKYGYDYEVLQLESPIKLGSEDISGPRIIRLYAIN